MINFLSIIPARGGSKGIPKKNIYPLNGKPLLAYTVEASLRSKYITDTIVSSDDNDILKVAERYGALAMSRPEALARDETLTEPVIDYVISNIQDFKIKYDYIVLLQATSPLRTSAHIDEAIELLLNKKSHSLISVKEIDNKCLKSFFINDQNLLVPISDVRYPFFRRQDLPNVYMPNGAIYIVSSNEFLRTKKLYTCQTIPYIMSADMSTDIDGLNDIAICERLLSL